MTSAPELLLYIKNTIGFPRNDRYGCKLYFPLFLIFVFLSTPLFKLKLETKKT